MDSLFSKFGIFDFLGVMGPGIISISYNMVCYSVLTGNWSLFSNSNLFDINVITIIVFLMISYLYGIILHEFGKFVYDNCSLFKIPLPTLYIPERMFYNDFSR